MSIPAEVLALSHRMESLEKRVAELEADKARLEETLRALGDPKNWREALCDEARQ